MTYTTQNISCTYLTNCFTQNMTYFTLYFTNSISFYFSYFSYFKYFTCLPNVSIIAHVSQYLPCFTIFCEILHTDFTGMPWWQHCEKFQFATAMLSDCTPAAAMFTAASRIQSLQIAYSLQVNLWLFKLHRRHRRTLAEHPLAVVQHHHHDKSRVLADALNWNLQWRQLPMSVRFWERV